VEHANIIDNSAFSLLLTALLVIKSRKSIRKISAVPCLIPYDKNSKKGYADTNKNEERKAFFSLLVRFKNIRYRPRGRNDNING
jgi:hypothetical protein